MTDIEKSALELIGANIQAYGHFLGIEVLDANGHSFEKLTDFTKEEVFQMVVDYYDLNKNLYSISDQDNITEARGCKRFIKKHINDESLNIGLEWLSDHTFLNYF